MDDEGSAGHLLIAEDGPTELAMSRAWLEPGFPRTAATVNGAPFDIVHRGTWTHSLGPDFRDAMVVFGGREFRSGSVELHRRTSGWRAHGHHLDPRYNDVVLHVVRVHDGAETRRQDGALVPVAELGDAFDAVIALLGPPRGDWARVGGAVCAAGLAEAQPEVIRQVLWHLGDTRLALKAARLEATFADQPPGETLWSELLDGLGYAQNRAPMGMLARLVPLAALEALLGTVGDGERLDATRGVLLGAAGFLPMSPNEAYLGGLDSDDVARAEDEWHRRGSAWHQLSLAPTLWQRARVRPANHPVRRLAAAALIVANAQGGLVSNLLEPLRQGTDAVAALRLLATGTGAPLIGADRAHAMVGNGLIPFALALAEQTGDGALTEAAARSWEQLPQADANEITKRAMRQVAGDVRVTGLGARGQQGLIHLDGGLCGPRRCFECPIGHRVVLVEDTGPSQSGQSGEFPAA